MTAEERRAGTGNPILGRGTWATHAALVLVQLAFASQAVEAKIAMLPRPLGGEDIFPEALAMMRMAGGALFFQGLLHGAPSLRASTRAPLDRRTHLVIVGLSVLGIALNQGLFLVGLRWTTPFSVSLLNATIPVLTAALAVLFGKEKLVWRTAAGLLLSVSGVFALTGVGSPSTQDVKGSVLVALNSLSFSAYVVLSRDVVRRVGAIRLVAWLFTYATILFAPFGLASLVRTLPELTPRGWFFVLYIVLVPTILAYVLNAWALARSSATIMTIYIYLQPLIAGVLARIQLGSAIPRGALLAAVLILAGLGIVASRAPEGR